jgi:hypothetical protein
MSAPPFTLALSKHFEASNVPARLPHFLPDDWKDGLVLLVMMMWIDDVHPLQVLEAYVAAGTAMLAFGVPAALQQQRYSDRHNACDKRVLTKRKVAGRNAPPLYISTSCAMPRATDSRVVALLAPPAAFFEVPAPLALHPGVRRVVIAVTFAHPSPAHPDVAMTVPVPVAGRPDVPDPGRRNDFDPRRRRCDVDVHVHSRLAGNRYRDRPQGQRRNNDSSSH